MLYIIDGTGPNENEVYERGMNGSFCDRMREDFRGRYSRGPSLWGTETYEIADKVYAEIKGSSFLGRQPLFLAGHSRGGAATIYVAQKLRELGTTIDALFLFDAVDRTVSAKHVQLIPKNVRVTYHARRDTSIATYFEWGARKALMEYEECENRSRSNAQWNRAYNRNTSCESQRQLAIKYRRLDDAMKVRMRSSYTMTSQDGLGIDFGNCGVRSEDSSGDRYFEQMFLGSHGALGGSPIGEQDGAWKSQEDKARFRTIKESDRAAMATAWDWMSQNFEKEKLNLHDGVRSEAKRDA